MTKVYIYVLKHPETLEIRYVGLTRYPTKRLNDELSCPHTKHFANWINSIKKLGLKPIMEIIEDTEEGAACDAERKWITEMKLRGCRLLNFTDGGESGFKVSEDVRKANSERQKGKKLGPMSDEHKDKISSAHRGTKKPWASKRLIELNKSRKGIPLSEERRRQLPDQLKKGWTKDARLRASLSHKGKVATSILKRGQVSEIKFLLIEGYSIRMIAELFCVGLGTISDIKRNKSWIDVKPTDRASRIPPFKSVPLFRNDKGQYKRAA